MLLSISTRKTDSLMRCAWIRGNCAAFLLVQKLISDNFKDQEQEMFKDQEQEMKKLEIVKTTQNQQRGSEWTVGSVQNNAWLVILRWLSFGDNCL